MVLIGSLGKIIALGELLQFPTLSRFRYRTVVAANSPEDISAVVFDGDSEPGCRESYPGKVPRRRDRSVFLLDCKLGAEPGPCCCNFYNTIHFCSRECHPITLSRDRTTNSVAGNVLRERQCSRDPLAITRMLLVHYKSFSFRDLFLHRLIGRFQRNIAGV